jgi:predicted nucleic acid-binding protein
LILVDSSAWVDSFSSSPGEGGAELWRLINIGEPVAVAGVIVAEVLQGLTKDPTRIESFLSGFDLLKTSGFDTYRVAASLYRRARAKGVSPSTIDTLIAAIAVENGAPIFTLDRDFSRLAMLTPIELYRVRSDSIN